MSTIPINFEPRQGWQCPLCKTVYSPSIPFCMCAKLVPITITNPTTDVDYTKLYPNTSDETTKKT